MTGSRMMRGLRAALAAATALTAIPALSDEAPSPAGQQQSQNLEQQFQDPPNSARPRVWWHWMNGNITKDGIAKDLAWMKAVGIGGMQNFDANLNTPQIVDNRLEHLAGSIDVVLAGPPCQGHSNLNNHTRRSDRRNELYLTVPAFAVAVDAAMVVIGSRYIATCAVADRAPRLTMPIDAACRAMTTMQAAMMRIDWPRRLKSPCSRAASATMEKASARSGEDRRLWPSAMICMR